MNIEKIIIIGLGSIGSKHLDILRILLPKSIIMVMHHNKSKKYPKKSDGVLENHSDAIAFKPDLVVISNPSSFHLKTAMIFLSLKTNIFIEKPLSNNLQNIRKFISKFKKNNSFVTIGYNLRFLSSLNKFKKIIDKQLLGEIFNVTTVTGQYLPSWRKYKNYTNTVSANKKLGGGVLLELSHEIDYLNWIFGDIQGVYSVNKKLSKLSLDVEDISILILYFKSKIRNKKFNALLTLDFLRHAKKRECVVLCEKGTIRWDGMKGILEIYKQNGKKWINLHNDPKDLTKSYINQWKKIIQNVKDNKKPTVNIFDGIKVLEVIDSSWISSREQKYIQVRRAVDR